MRLLIIDEHPPMVEMLSTVTRSAFIGAAIDGYGSLGHALRETDTARRADMVLLGLELPDCVGLQTFDRFREARPEPPVLLFSAEDDRATALAALQAGAAGFVPKSSPEPVIRAALLLVAAGSIYVPPSVIGKASLPASSDNARLTLRQRDVLRLIARGLRNKEIARALQIAEDTVKQHASAAYASVGISSRAQLIHAVASGNMRLD